MELRSYLKRGQRADFAKRVGVTLSHLNHLCAGGQPSPVLAKRIENATAGAVTAAELRPDVFGDGVEGQHAGNVAAAG